MQCYDYHPRAQAGDQLTGDVVNVRLNQVELPDPERRSGYVAVELSKS